MPVSDEEYNAALALDVWSYQMINKGKHSSDDFTLEENIEYITLLMAYEHQSGTINSLSDKTPELIMLGRLIKLISLKNSNLLEKFCR
jgi:hypothetical protein